FSQFFAKNGSCKEITSKQKGAILHAKNFVLRKKKLQKLLSVLRQQFLKC
ncbi:5798_t:CDS:1, partial [Funneliformis mosseae]